MTSPLLSELRRLRTERGWSQARIAGMAGISRQSYAAIEAARSVPSTEVALRLGRALEIPVETLFRLAEDEPETIPAIAAGVGAPLPNRVRLGRIDDTLVAYGLEAEGVHAGVLADGTAQPVGDGAVGDGAVEDGAVEDGAVEVRLLPDRRPPPDLVVAGCDPAFGLAVRQLEEQGMDVLWIRAGSEAALRALARGVVHVAGIHLRDAATGSYNEPSVRRLVPFPTSRIAFSVWEQALVCAAGNPLRIEGVRDLARPDVRLLNREAGSGARALLDLHLAEARLDPEAVRGYRETAARGHQEVVSGVAAGAADVGVAIRAAAQALGLPAVLLAEEPYDLVIPERLMAAPAVEALLRTMRTPRLRRQVEAMGGYDTSVMGRVA